MARRRRRGLTRAQRLARRLRILAAVIREPGLTPQRLASLVGVSERTLFRDLRALRRSGYPIVHGDGYRVQELLQLDGRNPAQGLAAVYEHQMQLLRGHVPTDLVEAVEEEVNLEAPAALAVILATAIERRLTLVRAAGQQQGPRD